MGRVYTPESLKDIIGAMQDQIERLEKRVQESCYATGDIRMTAGLTFDKSSWIRCDGGAYSRTQYPDLNQYLAAKDYPFGAGDGSTTFNVPNSAGRVPIGAGIGTGNGSSGVSGSSPSGGTALTERIPGEWGGEEKHVQTLAELAIHSHVAKINLSASGGGDGNTIRMGLDSTYGLSALDNQIKNSGSSSPMNIVQPFIVYNFYIKT